MIIRAYIMPSETAMRGRKGTRERERRSGEMKDRGGRVRKAAREIDESVSERVEARCVANSFFRVFRE